jgi:hypothetical protein
MSSGELEVYLTRDQEFRTVIRAGRDEGQAGLYNGVTGSFLGGVGGGWIPEYSTHRQRAYDCACTKGGTCRSGAHGIYLIRGWRNIVHEFLASRKLRPTKAISRLMGDRAVRDALVARPESYPGVEPGQVDGYASV